MTSAEGGDIPGASPRNLWSALSLAKINEMLSKPLSEEDMSFNQVRVLQRVTALNGAQDNPDAPSREAIFVFAWCSKPAYF